MPETQMTQTTQTTQETQKSDYAHDQTDGILVRLERRIKQIFRQASDEMKGTVKNYFNDFVVRDVAQQEKLDAGQITQNQYKQWRLSQMARGKRFQRLQLKLADRYLHAHESAMAYINGSTPEIYALNRNFAEYMIEKEVPHVSFTLWDEHTVKRLIKDEPDLMPNYPKAKAIDREIDLEYGKDQIRKSVTSGILQGKSIDGIADDLIDKIDTMGSNSAIRAARTATTSAENGGRQDSYAEAETMGIQMEKQWLATLDERTRPTHQQADGQKVPQDKPFKVGSCEMMFPADPDGDPCEVYNCRCTMISQIKGVDTSDAQRWAKDSDGTRYKVSGMTYPEWVEWKKSNR